MFLVIRVFQKLLIKIDIMVKSIRKMIFYADQKNNRCTAL